MAANHGHSNSHSGSHAGHGSSDHHVIELGSYIKVFIGLLFLTVVTVAAARVDFGALNAIIAFGIASVKAGLVLAIFMHLKYDDMLNRVIIGSGVFFLIVLLIFCKLDELTRIVHLNTL